MSSKIMRENNLFGSSIKSVLTVLSIEAVLVAVSNNVGDTADISGGSTLQCYRCGSLGLNEVNWDLPDFIDSSGYEPGFFTKKCDKIESAYAPGQEDLQSNRTASSQGNATTDHESPNVVPEPGLLTESCPTFCMTLIIDPTDGSFGIDEQDRRRIAYRSSDLYLRGCHHSLVGIDGMQPKPCQVGKMSYFEQTGLTVTRSVMFYTCETSLCNDQRFWKYEGCRDGSTRFCQDQSGPYDRAPFTTTCKNSYCIQRISNTFRKPYTSRHACSEVNIYSGNLCLYMNRGGAVFSVNNNRGQLLNRDAGNWTDTNAMSWDDLFYQHYFSLCYCDSEVCPTAWNRDHNWPRPETYARRPFRPVNEASIGVATSITLVLLTVGGIMIV